MLIQQLDQGLVVVHLDELPQGRHHLPPAALHDAFINDLSEVLLLLQVCQELQGDNHVVACTQRRGVRFEQPSVFKPAPCLSRQYPVRFTPVVLLPSPQAAHHQSHCLLFLA